MFHKRKSIIFYLILLISIILSCGKVSNVAQEAGIALSENMGPLKFKKEKLDTVVVENPYKEIILMEGGIRPLTYKITDGNLFDGLSLDENTGTLSGTVRKANANKKTSVTVLVHDANGDSVSKLYEIISSDYSFVIAPDDFPEITPERPFSFSILAVNASPPVKYSSSGSLPQGLTMDETGKFSTDTSGISAKYQTTSNVVKITAVDANAVQVSKEYTIKVGNAVVVQELSITTTELAAPKAGDVYAAAITAQGGVPPYEFSIVSGTLPTGLSLEATSGTISGTPALSTGGSAFVIKVQLKDAIGTTVKKDLSAIVKHYTFSIIPNEIPTITPDMEFSYNLVAVGAEEPVTYLLTGALPPGLGISGTGKISTGTTGVPGGYYNRSYPVTITATDANDVRVTKAFTINIGDIVIPPLTIATETINNPTAGVAYAASVGLTGGIPPYSFRISSGTLPSGLTLNALTGVISGTPSLSTARQNFVITVTASDLQGSVAHVTYQNSVNTYAISIFPLEIPIITPETNFSFTLSTLGGADPLSYSVVSGSLPPGLSMSSGGQFTVSGGGVSRTYQNTTYTPTIRVIDANLVQTQRQYTLSIGAAVIIAPLAVQTDSLPTPTAGSNYIGIVSVTGGVSPYHCELISGALPSGLSINASTGVISGTPARSTVGTQVAIIVKVTDAQSSTVQKAYSFQVSNYTLELGPSSLPSGTPEGSYLASLSALGGEAPYTFSVVDGDSLPIGLSLNTSTGIISGVISSFEAGLQRTFSIRVRDLYNITTTRQYTMTTSTYPIIVSTTSLANATEGNAYSASLSATGGSGTYTFEYSGTLPTGLAVRNDGQIIGTPANSTGTINGTRYNIQVRARDENGLISALKALSIQVGVSPPVVSVGNIPQGSRGISFSHTFTATGGRLPYTFPTNTSPTCAGAPTVACITGSLPTGLSMSSGGIISGVPSVTGTYTISFKISDSLGQLSSTINVNIIVVNGVVLSTSSLPTGVRGNTYSKVLSAEGGTSPYTYNCIGLPTGIVLVGDTLAGVPTADSGTYSVYVTATDQNSQSGFRTFSLVVSDAVVVNGATLPVAGAGRSYARTITATGGTSPYFFSISSGSLPTGLALNSGNGIISGSVTSSASANSPYNFSIIATDTTGLVSNPVAFSIEVQIPPKITSTILTPARKGQAYSAYIETQGGTPLFTFSAPSGLPSGLTLNSTSGIISSSNVSANAGNVSFPITLTDSKGLSTTQTISSEIISNSATTTTNFSGSHFSEICPTATVATCGNTKAFRVGAINPGGNNPSTKYVVFSQGVLGTPASYGIYISKIGSNGFITPPGTSSSDATNTLLITPAGFVGDIEITDADNDGLPDIIYADYDNNTVNVLWNLGDSGNGVMPNFNTGTMTILSLPGLDAARNPDIRDAAYVKPYTLKAVALNPSIPTAKDLLVLTDWNLTTPTTTYSRLVMMKSSCIGPGSCSANRATIYSAADMMPLDNVVVTGGVLATQQNNSLQYATNIEVGDFYSSNNGCLNIAITGKRYTPANSYLLIFKQDKIGAVCQKTFSNIESKLLNATYMYPGGMAVGKFNNDTYDDIAVTYGDATYVNVFLMTGAALPAAASFTPSIRAAAHKIIPLCLDGTNSCSLKSLLVAVGREPYTYTYTGAPLVNMLSILPNSDGQFDNGSGSGRIDLPLPTGLRSSPVLSQIFNNGGYDLVMLGIPIDTGTYVNNLPYFLTLENNGNNALYPFKSLNMLKSFPDSFATIDNAGTILAKDITGDGRPDLITHIPTSASLAVQINDGSGNFSATSSFSTGVQHALWPDTNHNPKTIDSADFNNDGREDIAVIGYTSRAIGVLLAGDSPDYLSPSPAVYSAGTGDSRPIAIATGDIDADGKSDIVFIKYVNNLASYYVSWLRGKGDGNFYASQDLVSGTSALGCSDPRTLQIIDLDGDRRPEITVGCSAYAYVIVFHRHTNGNWIKNNLAAGWVTPLRTSDTNTNQLFSYTFGQLTPGDSCAYLGRPCTDLIITTTAANSTIRILKNITLDNIAGDGSFNINSNGITTQVDLMGTSHDVAIGDFDRDGYLDIAAPMMSQNSQTINNGQVFYILQGNNTGNFPYKTAFGLQNIFSSSIVSNYFNADNLLDIAMGYRLNSLPTYSARLPYSNISQFLNLSTSP